jgi:hypothetical protein
MSQTSDLRSADFLKIADQFKLGALTTESSHPVTANLSEVAKQDIAAGLKLLFDVDDDVVRKYREFAESGRARVIADTVVAALRNGGNLVFYWLRFDRAIEHSTGVHLAGFLATM